LPQGVAFSGTARFDDQASALHLQGGCGAVFFGDLTRRLAVEVEALRRRQQGADVGRAGGVPVQEDRQRFLAEQARRALLDVGLDAQLERQHLANAEQRREVLGQGSGTGGRRQLGDRGASGRGGFGRGLGCGFCRRFSGRFSTRFYGCVSRRFSRRFSGSLC